MTERRRFNQSERAALYVVADGCCESCGVELEPGWHGDHVIPHSQGGPTDVINGAALCPTCNLKKGARMTDPRSRWQREAADKFHASDGRDFLITACPGSGKTRFALGVASDLLTAGVIERVIVLAPTARIRTQWVAAAAALGIDLTTGLDLPRDAHGTVITYHLLGRNQELVRKVASRRPTLLIADEVHRTAEDDQRTWGPALQHAFQPAVRRILLSGTPFRTDGSRIPFITYDDNGMAVPDYSIAYGKAVELGITRSIRFEVMDGEAQWQRGAQRFTAKARDVSEDDRSALLSTLYKPDSRWIGSILATADAELSRQREEKPNAGGLLIAPDQPTARAYGALLSKLTGEDTAVVISEDADDMDRTLDSFRDGAARWIVAVRIISEGVDIPRLTTLVFASRTLTEMWFRQVVGRITRQDGDPITATMFIPAVSGLVDMAGRIEGESQSGLFEAERKAREGAESEQRTLEFDLVTPLWASDASRTQVIERGEEFSDAELRRARDLSIDAGGDLGNVQPSHVARLLRLAGAGVPVGHLTATPPAGPSQEELRRILRLRVQRDVGRISFEVGTPHRHIHAELNRMFGDTAKTATVTTLEKRLEVLASWPR